MHVLDPETFCREIALSFPRSVQADGSDAARALLPFINLRLGVHIENIMVVSNYQVRIPRRIQFVGISVDQPINELNLSTAALCLLTRSTDGYLRQAALRHIVMQNQPWVIPYVALLAGEYVIEIIDDIVAALPDLDKKAYKVFVRENRGIMRLLRSRASSYWNVYYRRLHPKQHSYPGLIFLNQLDSWAR